MRHDDIHSVAEKFLKEYLAKTGSKHAPLELSSAALHPAGCAAEAQAVAKEFVKQHVKKTRHEQAQQRAKAQASTNAERYEIEEPQQVILSRRGPRCVSYFYGFKHGLPVFTYDKALARVIKAANRDELSRFLREKHKIETFVLPAPELQRGSL